MCSSTGDSDQVFAVSANYLLKGDWLHETDSYLPSLLSDNHRYEFSSNESNCVFLVEQSLRKQKTHKKYHNH